MALSDLLDKEFNRVRLVFLAMLASLIFLGAVLWRVQVVNSREYRSSLDRQSTRRVRLPATRGIICDRNGVALADNRPSYCIALFIEELRRPGKWDNTIDEVERVIALLESELGLERQVTREEIGTHIYKRLPLPFLAWRDIDQTALARWAEAGVNLPGVDIYVEPVRVYPNGLSAAHVLGRVGRAELQQDEENPYHFYLPEMEGKKGIEAVMNDRLAGIPGGELLRVDASGFKYGKIGERPPEPGGNVWLTLDIRIQRLADAALEGETGAVVILDPRNGEVLAMASSPAFDPNMFVPSLSAAEWEELTADGKKDPLFNRAIRGGYPPGSTFKPLVAIAALESGRATADTTFNCPGYFTLKGGATFRCWSRRGHGLVSMRKAVEQSCNAYFCQLGLKCEHERICRMAEAVGFGMRTGIELPFELPGLVPDNAWKVRRFNDRVRAGDTCNLSIGQGALIVTPVQMAMFVAATANGGTVFRPALILRREKKARGKKMAWSSRNLKVVRDGMYDVVQAENGTGKRARIDEFAMGGKTGSAEYGPRENRKKYAWMIAFGPFDKPRYAIAMVIEDAVSGGVTAAPRIKALMEGICRLERTGTVSTVARADLPDRAEPGGIQD